MGLEGHDGRATLESAGRATETSRRSPADRLNSNKVRWRDTVPIPAAARFQYPPGTPAGVVVGVGVQQALQIWQSPYPPPDAIERYEKVCPGALDRILEWRSVYRPRRSSRPRPTHNSHRTTRARPLARFRSGHSCADRRNCEPATRQSVVAGLCLSVPVMAVAKALIDSAKASPSTEPPATQPTTPPPATQA